jgi:hypothetical protein
MYRVLLMTSCRVRMMRGLSVVTIIVMFGGFVMMMCGSFVVLGGLTMMVRSFFGHG